MSRLNQAEVQCSCDEYDCVNSNWRGRFRQPKKRGDTEYLNETICECEILQKRTAEQVEEIFDNLEP